MVRFDLLYGKLCGFQRRRCESLEKSFHNGLIDLNTSDVQTVHVAPRNDILAGAVITGHRVSAGVMRVEPTTTFSARGQALQQCGAFPHGASRLVWPGMHVGIEACLVGLERSPINVAGMMLEKEHRPLGHGQKAGSFAQPSFVIHVAFTMRPPVKVCASIHRVGEHTMDSVVGRGDPTDRALHRGS